MYTQTFKCTFKYINIAIYYCARWVLVPHTHSIVIPCIVVHLLLYVKSILSKYWYITPYDPGCAGCVMVLLYHWFYGTNRLSGRATQGLRLNRQMDRWTDGQTDRRTDGHRHIQTQTQTHLCIYTHTQLYIYIYIYFFFLKSSSGYPPGLPDKVNNFYII